jgi:hypothetical protein
MDHEELISSGVTDIASSLGLGDRGNLDESPPPDSIEETPPPDGADTGDTPLSPEGEQPPEGAATTETAVRQPPKSWAKETHELWAKIPPEAQAQIEHREKQMLEGLGQYKEHSELGRSIKEVVTPYMPMLHASGVDPAKAVAVLLNANYRLTTGPVEARRQAFIELGASLGLVPQQNVPQEPPAVREMRERLAKLEGSLTQREQQQYEEARTRVTSEVEVFAKDAPYFDEVADDMVPFLNAGADLKTAYDKAIYANPVTRAKELSRIQKEAGDKLKAKSSAEVSAAKRSTAANVRGHDTNRTPTESRGKLFDDSQMREDLRAIKARPH